MTLAFLMIAVQMAKPAQVDMVARTAAEADAKSAQLYLRRMGILVETKAGEPRPKIGEESLTDMARDMIDRMKPSNKRQYATRELLPSDDELAKAVSWRMLLV